jgi:hypothetical protein
MWHMRRLIATLLAGDAAHMTHQHTGTVRVIGQYYQVLRFRDSCASGQPAAARRREVDNQSTRSMSALIARSTAKIWQNYRCKSGTTHVGDKKWIFWKQGKGMRDNSCEAVSL